MRHAFEPGTGVVSNWDVMEGLLDSTFVNLGIDGVNGGIDRPVVMTEPVANLGYSRKSKIPTLDQGSSPLIPHSYDRTFI